MTDSTLSSLRHEELCVIVLQDGHQFDAKWSANNRGFYYRDGGTQFISAAEVYELWPASVKY